MRLLKLEVTDTYDEPKTIASIIAIAPEGRGYSEADNKAGLAVTKALGAHQSGAVYLKETEWGWLKTRLGQQTWGALSEKIVELLERVREGVLVDDVKSEGDG